VGWMEIDADSCVEAGVRDRGERLAAGTERAARKREPAEILRYAQDDSRWGEADGVSRAMGEASGGAEGGRVAGARR
jgi:hypothetical protein